MSSENLFFRNVEFKSEVRGKYNRRYPFHLDEMEGILLRKEYRVVV